MNQQEQWEKEFDEKFGEIDVVQADYDLLKGHIRSLLSSRDTYWKERVKDVEDVLMEQYKEALQNNDERASNGYAHSLAIVKCLYKMNGVQELTNEDNLK